MSASAIFCTVLGSVIMLPAIVFVPIAIVRQLARA
jgi:hypothetical protein